MISLKAAFLAMSEKFRKTFATLYYATICVALVDATSTSAAPPKECRVNAALQQKLGQWTALTNATYPWPALQQLDVVRFPPSFQTADATATVPAGPCPLNDVDRWSSREDPLNERSLCPWGWRPSYDPRRSRALLMEARCLCDRTSSESEYECEPVYYKIRVLRFDQPCRRYRVAYEKLAVACVPIAMATVRMIPPTNILVDEFPWEENAV